MKRLVMIMPMLALIFGLTVFLGNAAIKKHSMIESDEWRFDGADPAKPENYSPAPENTQEECEGIAEVCVVIAPPMPNEKMPDLDAVPGLKDALEGNLDHDNIIKGPYNPQVY